MTNADQIRAYYAADTDNETPPQLSDSQIKAILDEVNNVASQNEMSLQDIRNELMAAAASAAMCGGF